MLFHLPVNSAKPIVLVASTNLPPSFRKIFGQSQSHETTKSKSPSPSMSTNCAPVTRPALPTLSDNFRSNFQRAPSNLKNRDGPASGYRPGTNREPMNSSAFPSPSTSPNATAPAHAA